MNIIADCHTHTILSGHAYSTLTENVEEAKSCGLKIIASTDHAPLMPGTCHIYGVNNQGARPSIINGIHVLKGVEANIMNINGDVDLDDNSLRRMEIAIASLHEPIFEPKTKEIHTQTYLNLIKQNKIDIIGHSGNPHYDYEHETVLRAAKEANVAIELNNSSLGYSRVGSREKCYEISKLIAKIGNDVFINSDAHFAYSIGKFDDAIEMVKACGIKEEQVVNADVDRLYDFLTKKRGRQIETRVY